MVPGQEANNDNLGKSFLHNNFITLYEFTLKSDAKALVDVYVVDFYDVNDEAFIYSQGHMLYA